MWVGSESGLKSRDSGVTSAAAAQRTCGNQQLSPASRKAVPKTSLLKAFEVYGEVNEFHSFVVYK